jgi:hypothetical protein
VFFLTLCCAAQPDQMLSFVRGASEDPISAAVTGGSVITQGTTTVYTHVPFADNTHGAAQMAQEASLLSNEVDVFTIVRAEDVNHQIVNPITRTRMNLGTGTYLLHYRLNMLSGLLGVPNGPDQATGELLCVKQQQM